MAFPEKEGWRHFENHYLISVLNHPHVPSEEARFRQQGPDYLLGPVILVAPGQMPGH
jgi:hypothetical protein